MALVIDSQEATATGHRSITSPLTWSFTNTGGTLILVGIVSTGSGGTAVIGAVTYGGDALTAIGTGQAWDTGASLAQWFYRLNPKTGAQTVSVSWTLEGLSPATLAGAISFTGNDGASPVGTEVKATGNSTAPDSGIVTSTSGDYIVSVGGSGSTGTYTPTSPDVATFTLTGSGGTAGDNLWASYFSSSGASHNMQWTVPADLWAIVAIRVKASTAFAGGQEWQGPISVPKRWPGQVVY